MSLEEKGFNFSAFVEGLWNLNVAIVTIVLFYSILAHCNQSALSKLQLVICNKIPMVQRK